MCSRKNSLFGNPFSYRSRRNVRPLQLSTRDYKKRKKRRPGASCALCTNAGWNNVRSEARNCSDLRSDNAKRLGCWCQLGHGVVTASSPSWGFCFGTSDGAAHHVCVRLTPSPAPDLNCLGRQPLKHAACSACSALRDGLVVSVHFPRSAAHHTSLHCSRQ